MIPEIDTEQAAKMLRADPQAVYLDVRTEPEFTAGHPAGAFNVPVFFFDAARRPVANADFERVVEAAFPKQTKILVGCQSGVRSQRAAEILSARGFADVHNVAGGFGGSPASRGWRDSGLPVETGASDDRGYTALKAKA
jgi:rhodanese-related sulfurtransferase